MVVRVAAEGEICLVSPIECDCEDIAVAFEKEGDKHWIFRQLVPSYVIDDILRIATVS